jgi:hypothetical protein
VPKITELPAHPLPVADSDVLAIVQAGAAGGPATRRTTLHDLLSGVGADFAGLAHVHGFWYPAGMFTGALAPVTPPTNKAWVLPVALQHRQRVTGLAVMVTAGEAGALARVALYADAQLEQGPGALLAETGALDCSGAAGFRIDVVDVEVPKAGVYWLAVNFQGFTVGTVGWNGFQTGLSLCGFTVAGPHVALSEGRAFGPWPAVYDLAGVTQEPGSQAPQPFFQPVNTA